MNLKASYKYVMYDNKKALIGYSLIIIAITVFLFVASVSWSNDSSTMQIGGMEMASVIFIFVAGLTSFKDNFHMLTQNSVTRRGTFTATMLGFITTAGMLSAISIIVLLIAKLMSSIQNNIVSTSFFETLYAGHVNGMNGFIVYLESFLLYFVMMLTVVGIGYLIGAIFYRLNKGGKVALAVGIPVFFSVILPIVDVLIFGGRVTIGLVRFMDMIFGISAQNPYLAVVSCMVIFLICGLLSWIVMRKAPVKA
jgi:TRAP-type C4-dicarboxylate transport system permease small subunit